MSIDHMSYRPFGARLGDALVRRDTGAVHALLAPWLQARLQPGDLEAELQRHIEAYAAENWDGATLAFYDHFNVSGNDSTWEELTGSKSGHSEDAPEVTPANFRAWLCLGLRGPETPPLFVGAATDLWLAVVEVDGQQRVGYHEVDDAD